MTLKTDNKPHNRIPVTVSLKPRILAIIDQEVLDEDSSRSRVIERLVRESSAVKK